MINATTLAGNEATKVGSAKLSLESFAHVSFPCRDLAEGKRFYVDVLGGVVRVDLPTFASIRIAGVDVGIGTEGLA
ncbi:MAG: hypothetical protein ACKVQU_09025 [Burkholderiales bacterium]